MNASKFNAEYAADTSRRMREALADAWALLDQLGAHADEAQKLEVLRGPKFYTAYVAVRKAMVLTKDME